MSGSRRASTLSWYSQLPGDSQNNHHNALGEVFYQHLNTSNASQSMPRLSPRLPEAEDSHPFAASTPTAHSPQSSSRPALRKENSFEIQHVTNIREIDPSWEDDDVDEIMVISPRKSRMKTLSIIPEDPEASRRHESVDVSSFQILQLLTSNGVSRIFACKRPEHSRVYAMKVIAKDHLRPSRDILQLVTNEQAVLKYIAQLSVPFAEKLYFSFQNPTFIYTVTDIYASTLSSFCPLTPEAAHFYAAELVEAVSSLHAVGVVHRNIQPTTVLLRPNGHLLLGGFGHAIGQTNHVDTVSTNVSDDSDQLQYQAPEMVLGWRHDRAVDIWAVALMLYAMLTGKHPFLDDEESHGSLIKSKILHAQFNSEALQSFDSGNEVLDMIRQCLERNPAMRPSIEDLKMHSSFSGVDWASIQDCASPGPIIPQVQFNVDEPNKQCLLTSPEDAPISHIDGFSFTLETPELQPAFDQPPIPQRSAQEDTSQDFSVTSLPSSFSCTSLGEIKEPRTYLNFDDSLDKSTLTAEDLSRRNTVGYLPQSLASMSTPERTPTRGLRKYASLNFELDTIVSLSHEDSDSDSTSVHNDRPAHGSRSTPLAYLPRWSPLKNFRFIRPQASSSPATHTSPYQNLTPEFTALADVNGQPGNKLRRKLRTPRSNSTPLLLPSFAQPLPDLPSHVEQIGSGIGYTHTRSPRTLKTNSTSGGESGNLETTPRRSSSLLPAASRYQSLLSDGFTALPRRLLRAKKRSQNLDSQTLAGEGPGKEEDEDEMDAVMKEMYGSTWDLNLGGHAATTIPRAPTTVGPGTGLRAAGLGFGFKSSSTPPPRLAERLSSLIPGTNRLKVPLDSSVDGTLAVGSTLRLVSPRVDDGF